jgi:Cyclin, N-terminal domain/Cyclin, C-terminal domain
VMLKDSQLSTMQNNIPSTYFFVPKKATMKTKLHSFQLAVDNNRCYNFTPLQLGPNTVVDNTRYSFQNTTNCSKAAIKSSDTIPTFGAPSSSAAIYRPKMITSDTVRSPSTMNPFSNAVNVVGESCEAPYLRATSESAPSPVDNCVAVQEIEAKFVSDHALDLYITFQKQELLWSIPPSYQSRQPHLSDGNRAILVNWMVDLQASFQFSDATLHLAVSLLDRFLDVTPVILGQLQLVGATCFWIASKYEERYLPIHVLVCACDGLYTRQEFVFIETKILSTLGYRLSLPTANTFLDIFLVVAKLDNRTRTMAHTVLKDALSSYTLLQYRPSELAAAAFLVAFRSTGKYTIAESLESCTGYEESAIWPVASAIMGEKEQRSSQEVEIQKYRAWLLS